MCVLQLLTNHYEQNWKFYCLPSGWGSYGTASEDELLLTKKIFWGVFDSLSQRVRGRSCVAQNSSSGSFAISLCIEKHFVRECNTTDAPQNKW